MMNASEPGLSTVDDDKIKCQFRGAERFGAKRAGAARPGLARAAKGSGFMNVFAVQGGRNHEA